MVKPNQQTSHPTAFGPVFILRLPPGLRPHRPSFPPPHTCSDLSWVRASTHSAPPVQNTLLCASSFWSPLPFAYGTPSSLMRTPSDASSCAFSAPCAPSDWLCCNQVTPRAAASSAAVLLQSGCRESRNLECLLRSAPPTPRAVADAL